MCRWQMGEQPEMMRDSGWKIVQSLEIEQQSTAAPVACEPCSHKRIRATADKSLTTRLQEKKKNGPRSAGHFSVWTPRMQVIDSFGARH